MLFAAVALYRTKITLEMPTTDSVPFDWRPVNRPMFELEAGRGQRSGSMDGCVVDIDLFTKLRSCYL